LFSSKSIGNSIIIINIWDKVVDIAKCLPFDVSGRKEGSARKVFSISKPSKLKSV
jgi:hypothetical protein